MPDPASAASEGGVTVRGGKAAMVDASGNVVAVPVDAVDQAIADGLGFADTDEIAGHELQKKYGGVGGAALALGQAAEAGAVDAIIAAPKLATRGISAALGTADPLAAVSGRQLAEDRDYVVGEALHLLGLGPGGIEFQNRGRAVTRGVAEANPTAADVGYVAGQVGGSLALGAGAGALAPAGTAAVSAAASGAEAATARLAPTLGGRALSLLGRTAAGSAEGAGLSAAAVSDEAYRRGVRLDADRLNAAMLGGALFGGALPLVGAAGRSLYRRAFGAAARDVEGAAGATVAGEVAPAEGAAYRETAGAAVPEGAAAPGLVQRGKAYAGALSDEAAVRQVTGSLRGTRTISQGGDEVALQRAGRVLKDTGIVDTATARGVVDNSGAAVARRAEAVAARAGDDIGDVLRRAEAAGGRFELEGLQARRATLVDELRGSTSPKVVAAADQIEARFALLERNLASAPEGGTHQVVRQFKTEIGHDINWAKQNDLPAVQKALKRLYGATAREIESNVQRSLGASDVAALRSANERFHIGSWAAQQGGDTTNRGVTNNLLGLLGTLGAVGGASIGGIGGAAAGALGTKAVRAHGWAAVSAIAGRLAETEGRALESGVAKFLARSGAPVRRVARLAVEEGARAETGIARSLARTAAGTSARATFAQRGESDQRAYQRRAGQIAELQASPELLHRTLTQHMASLAQVAPDLAVELTRRQTEALTFLGSKLPRPLNAPGLVPTVYAPRVPDSEIARFRRYWEGATDPRGTVDRLSAGTLTREHVEAMRAVYPDLYAEVATQVLSGMASMQRAPDYTTRIRVDTLLLLEGSAEPSLAPRFLAAQASRASMTAPPAGAPPRQIRIASLASTATTGA